MENVESFSDPFTCTSGKSSPGCVHLDTNINFVSCPRLLSCLTQVFLHIQCNKVNIEVVNI